MSGYYEILGLDKNAESNDIKKAYRKLAIKWHPDKNKGSKSAEEKFKEISEAYEVLSNEEKKKVYDQFGKEGLQGGAGSSGFSNGNFPDGVHYTFSGSGISAKDVFEQFFGTDNVFNVQEDDDGNSNGVHGFPGLFQGLSGIPGFPGMSSGQGGHGVPGFPGMPGMESHQPLPKGKSIEYPLMCTLEDLYNGKSKKMKIKRTNYTYSPPKQEENTVEINIQPGWKEGTKITYEGYNDVYPDEKPGDIIFVISEKNHLTFKRDNNDLHYTLDISLKEAISGFNKKIKLLNGGKVSVKKTFLSESIDTYIIGGKGMPVRKGGKIISQGDVIIRFNIIFPQLQKAEKVQLSALL